MSRCCSSGGRRCGGCGDHATCNPGLPDLTSIEVAGGIFSQAAANTVRRMRSLMAGDMSPEELDAADAKLADWLGATFSGRNRHYRSGEAWNPEGLADFLREALAEQIEAFAGRVPARDDEVICAAMAIFMRDLYGILGAAAQSGRDLEGIE
ncbi:MAG: hypothetical protein HUK26_06405, partial [Duodenibacillus sp.]|nr:hypothetical protein [Duodenibacillus sp.]